MFGLLRVQGLGLVFGLVLRVQGLRLIRAHVGLLVFKTMGSRGPIGWLRFERLGVEPPMHFSGSGMVFET